jgi:rubrerythrin
MQPGEVLYLYDRSSNPRKKGLVLINSVGVIDGDYYGNPDNEGHIFAQMKNITDQIVEVAKGERIVQGVFAPFLLADGDRAEGTRIGGFGSTGHKMAKAKSKFVCQSCGYQSPKYLGRCPNCGAWNSFVEEVEAKRSKMRA